MVQVCGWGFLACVALAAMSQDEPVPKVVSHRWSRYATELKMPPGMGGEEWSGFGVCTVELDRPGPVALTWTDTAGKKHIARATFQTKFGIFVVTQPFWKQGFGLPPFMLQAELKGEIPPAVDEEE